MKRDCKFCGTEIVTDMSYSFDVPPEEYGTCPCCGSQYWNGDWEPSIRIKEKLLTAFLKSGEKVVGVSFKSKGINGEMVSVVKDFVIENETLYLHTSDKDEKDYVELGVPINKIFMKEDALEAFYNDLLIFVD